MFHSLPWGFPLSLSICKIFSIFARVNFARNVLVPFALVFEISVKVSNALSWFSSISFQSIYLDGDNTRRKIGLLRRTGRWQISFLPSRLIRCCRKSKDQSRICCARQRRDIPSVNSLDRITGRICNPSQKYMLTGLTGLAGVATKMGNNDIAAPWVRAGTKRRRKENAGVYFAQIFYLHLGCSK